MPSTSTGRIRRLWTEEEDQTLRQAVNCQHDGAVKDWNKVALRLPGRTNKDCRKRWVKICRDLNKGTWDASEDACLREAIKKYGMRWTQVAKFVGTRHADQCAKRWTHNLAPSLDQKKWSEQDVETLLTAVSEKGRDWKSIAETDLRGRSISSIKSRDALHQKRSSANGFTSRRSSTAMTGLGDSDESSGTDAGDGDEDDDADGEENNDGDSEMGTRERQRPAKPSATNPEHHNGTSESTDVPIFPISDSIDWSSLDSLCESDMMMIDDLTSSGPGSFDPIMAPALNSSSLSSINSAAACVPGASAHQADPLVTYNPNTIPFDAPLQSVGCGMMSKGDDNINNNCNIKGNHNFRYRASHANGNVNANSIFGPDKPSKYPSLHDFYPQISHLPRILDPTTSSTSTSISTSSSSSVSSSVSSSAPSFGMLEDHSTTLSPPPSQTQPQPQSQSPDPRWKTVLVLDGITQSALYRIIAIAMENNSRIKMETTDHPHLSHHHQQQHQQYHMGFGMGSMDSQGGGPPGGPGGAQCMAGSSASSSPAPAPAPRLP